MNPAEGGVLGEASPCVFCKASRFLASQFGPFVKSVEALAFSAFSDLQWRKIQRLATSGAGSAGCRTFDDFDHFLTGLKSEGSVTV